jgi:hypothetical protein
MSFAAKYSSDAPNLCTTVLWAPEMWLSTCLRKVTESGPKHIFSLDLDVLKVNKQIILQCYVYIV